MNTTHLAMHADRNFTFQLLNEEKKAIAFATFANGAMIRHVAAPSITEQDLTLFHAECRNIMHSPVNLAAAEERAISLNQVMRAILEAK